MTTDAAPDGGQDENGRDLAGIAANIERWATPDEDEAARIRATVAGFPPLSGAQLLRLAALLVPDPPARGEAP